jgi:hypothetical protein|eukprot:COSAG06_NODE_2667_length_6473_cov_2.348917_4_plen_58_part_00
MPYNLRRRGPRRTDPLLCAIYDQVCDDALHYIALLAITRPPPYGLRSHTRRMALRRR